MGDIDIITFGGGDVLWKTYNAIALIFKSKSVYVTSLFTFAIGLGCLLAAIRAIWGQNFLFFWQKWLVPASLLLALFFLPKTSVHIVDKVDPHFHYSKVDNVPLGVALIPSVTSKISALLVSMIENAFRTPQSNRMSVTGGMFSARLADAAREARIGNPIMRQNVKDFLDRGFVWPFLYCNVKGLGQKARESDNILAFIQEHPHPSNGVYWREANGSTSFKSITECIPLIKEELKKESGLALRRLAFQLFPSGAEKPDEFSLKNKIEAHLSNGFQSLGVMVGKAHEAISQNLLLNAARESEDDGREISGLGRKWDHLIAVQGQRMLQSQGLMDLMRGNVGGTWIPTFQTIVFVLMVVFFVLLAPFCFLPGGFEALRTWTWVMLWIQLWPVFSSILYCIGDLYAHKAGISITGGGAMAAGITLSTQQALGDSAYQAYCWFQGAQISVPFLSWAVLKASPYAISGFASGVSQSLDAGASRAATETVDGNFSFDNQSFHNRSGAMVQYGRQELGPNFSFGQSIDTGSLTKTNDPVLGETVYQERLSSLKTEFSGEENMSAELSRAASSAQGIAKNDEMSYGSSLSNLAQKTGSFLESVASGKLVNENWSKDDQNHWTETAQKALHSSNNFQKEHSTTDSTAMQASLGLNIGIAGGGVDTSTQRQSAAQTLESFGKDERHQQDVGKLLQQAHQESWTSHTAQDAQKLNELRSSIDSAQSWSKTSQTSATRSHNLETASRLAESNGLSIRTDLTDEALDYVARNSFGGNRDEAVRLASHNPDQFRAQAQGYLTERKQGLVQKIASSDQILTPAALQTQLNEWQAVGRAQKDHLTRGFDTHQLPAHAQKGSPQKKAFDQTTSQNFQAEQQRIADYRPVPTGAKNPPPNLQETEERLNQKFGHNEKGEFIGNDVTKEHEIFLPDRMIGVTAERIAAATSQDQTKKEPSKKGFNP